MSNKSTDNIISLVAVAGGIVIAAKGKSTDNIIRIAQAAKNAGIVITVRNAGAKSTENLAQIARAYPKGVVLDLTE